MSNSNEIRVLHTFVPFLRLLSAFKCSHFQYGDWMSILRSMFCAFCVMVMIVSIWIWIGLIIWYLVENEANLLQFAIAIPVSLSVLQLNLTFVDLLSKSHTLSEQINQLQQVINHSELGFLLL